MSGLDFQTYLDRRGITKYRLSQISGVPKTTIMDICAGRSELERCSARTIRQLARALDCTMEEIMDLSSCGDDTGLPEDKSYLECGLPDFLRESILQMEAAWARLDKGEKYMRWDCDFCNLQTDINNAEVNGIISSEQAWYLREKYLGLERV
ncbi:MAG: helix-turn-helix transcriptional regulator [Firmicutes bacterium]|nr:helix-turn-helix transcriptional regulator [Bacillota bacterium]